MLPAVATPENTFLQNWSVAVSLPGEDVWETSQFHCQRLAPNVYLLTYTLIQNKIRKTRRSTLWQYTEVGWKILFHQGTMVED